jgi:subtilisin family serine protease
VAQLKKKKEVKQIEPDAVVTIKGTQNSPPWGLTRISQRERVANTPYRYPDSAGSGVTVYVIDTGIQTSHPEFQGRARWGNSFCDNCGNTDDNGHGTHCAGTIGSRSYGVAKNVNLVAVKVLDQSGSGTNAGVIAGIDWVAQQSGSRVVSMSLGGPQSSMVNQAVVHGFQSGVHFAVAAGNEFSDACNVSPASVEEVLTVGAIDISDNMASFSNSGRCVDIFAPGVDIESTWTNGGTKRISGTSMATPHVAGAIALLLGDSPGLSPSQLIEEMKSNATPNKVRYVPGETVNSMLYVRNARDPADPPSFTSTWTPSPTSQPTDPTWDPTDPTWGPTDDPTDPHEPDCHWWDWWC